MSPVTNPARVRRPGGGTRLRGRPPPGQAASGRESAAPGGGASGGTRSRPAATPPGRSWGPPSSRASTGTRASSAAYIATNYGRLLSGAVRGESGGSMTTFSARTLTNRRCPTSSPGGHVNRERRGAPGFLAWQSAEGLDRAEPFLETARCFTRPGGAVRPDSSPRRAAQGASDTTPPPAPPGPATQLRPRRATAFAAYSRRSWSAAHL